MSLDRILRLSADGNGSQEMENLIHQLTALVVMKYGAHHGEIRIVIQDAKAVRWEVKVSELIVDKKENEG